MTSSVALNAPKKSTEQVGGDTTMGFTACRGHCSGWMKGSLPPSCVSCASSSSSSSLPSLGALSQFWFSCCTGREYVTRWCTVKMLHLITVL